MTVTYTTKVSNTSFCGFSKLLFRWRGSVFKLLGADLIVYFLLYFSVAAIYRFALRENEKRIFEKIAITCEYFRNVFPISFVLGFYVTIVVQRWWEQYMLIPWPDTVCILASTYIEGQDERGRLLRRSFARYINLAFALAFSRISPRVARRLSTYQMYIDAGYMTADERVIFEMMDSCTQHHKIWMPLVWASLIVRQARREGRCPDDHGQKAVVTEITNLRYNCGKLQEYHTMSVPLVYTQVVTLATYSYFAFSILGRQFLDPAQGYENHSVDFYVPIFTLFQFVFYVGWLKVAESLLNPFGDDDDDFETTEFLDRHLEVSYMIVDSMHKLYPDVLHPPGTKDLAVPLNSVLSRHAPTNSAMLTKTPSLSGQSDGEKSPVVKYCEELVDGLDPQSVQQLNSPSSSLPRTSRSPSTPPYRQVSIMLQGSTVTGSKATPTAKLVSFTPSPTHRPLATPVATTSLVLSPLPITTTTTTTTTNTTTTTTMDATSPTESQPHDNTTKPKIRQYTNPGFLK